MTDNRTTELLRKLLEERGVEYDVKALRRTEWTVNGVIWNANEYDGKLNVYVRNNDMLLTPEQAIAATLGNGTLTAEQVREAMEGAKIELLKSCEYVGTVEERQDDVLKAISKMKQTVFEELNTEPDNGTLTVEQVREAIFNSSTYATYDGTRFNISGIDMQAIADELNAELGSGTCEMVVSGTPCNGNTDVACSRCGAYNIGEFYDGHGHRSSPRFCPNCGAKAVGR